MKYLKILIWPIIFMIGQFFIQYLFVAIFNNKYYHNIDLYSIINTLEYKNKLNNYINDNTLLIMIIVSLIFIPFFYLIYKKYKVNTKLEINKIIYVILSGIILSSIYNLYLSIITDYKISNLPIFIQIISSGLLGPIMEELLFRGIVYNKLKEFNSIKKSIIISTIIFSLIHSSLINIIYTFFMGYVLVYLYEKYKSLKYPIIFHISANTSVILLSLIISFNIVYLNIILLSIFLIFLCIYYYMSTQIG